jgi:hypothetical protein
MKRREMLKGLAAGVAGAVAAPGMAASDPQAQAPATTAAPGQPPDQAPARLLDDHRRAVLADLSDRILPGARAAGVVDLLDRVLAVETTQAQRRFLNALGAFERESRDRHARGWMEVTDAQRIDILGAASTLASARPAPKPWTRGEPVERPAAPPAPPANLRDHFDHLKDWIQRAYFTTAPGMKELGFTGRMAFPAFPGCSATPRFAPRRSD